MTKHKLRSVLVAGAFLASSGVFAFAAPAHADWRDHDPHWRAHERHEIRERRDEHWRRHWDHAYWDRDREVYVYRPPTAVYEPAPSPGVSFMFGINN